MKNGERVRAKFECISITDFGNAEEIKMRAVYSDKGENKAFTEATPSGEFSIRIDRDAPAFGKYKVGQHYYLDITEAPSE